MLLKSTRTMPHGGGTRIQEGSWQYHVLHDWVAGGAAGVSASDAKLDRVEVLPKHAVLKPKDSLRVVVLGHYSDGRVVDVSRLAKFVSSEAQVADADEEGTIKVAGHGEAAVSAIFDNRVATVTVTSPFPNSVDEAVFTRSPKANSIDDHVLRKLRELRLPPSPQCSDSEFIRRAYLDAAGILPTPEEVSKFLADPAADKRARLIDALLERPEFVDYWAYKWCDVMLVSTRKLPQPAMWAFYRVGPPGRRGQQAVGPLRPRPAVVQRQLAPQRSRQFLRTAQGRGRPHRVHGPHVPGHVDHVRPMP